MNSLKIIMVKIMKYKIIFSMLLIISLIVLVPSFKKVNLEYKSNLYLVTESRITQKAFLCFKESKCSNTTVYLSELYLLGYLSDEFDPVTKEYYSEESYVILDDEKTEFISIY